jgi:hypothetical protein
MLASWNLKILGVVAMNEVDETIVEDEPEDQTECPGYPQCGYTLECSHPQNLPCGL